MFVQLLAATGLLAALTMVPVPDTAVVTERALAAGRRDGLRTVDGLTTGLLVRGALTVIGPVEKIGCRAAGTAPTMAR